MTTMIETENLKYAYPADEEGNMVFALRGVDLRIEKGTFVVVLGHNGSGKSTLAKTFNASGRFSIGTKYFRTIRADLCCDGSII